MLGTPRPVRLDAEAPGPACASGCPCHAGLQQAAATLCRLALASFGAALLTLRPPSLARAQAASPAGSKPTLRVLERHEVAGTDQDMSLVEVVFPPGLVAALHHHLVPGLNFIVEGVAESAYATDPPRTYRAGDTLQDLANVPHTIFRNPDGAAPLRFLIFYVLGRNQPYTAFP